MIQKGEQKMLMYYWYQQRERQSASEFTMKYYILVDSVLKGRKDGALVRLLTPIQSGGGGESEANARLRAFAQSIAPVMPNFLPQ